MAFGILTIILLPTLVSAEYQVAVTEIANFGASEDNNEEVVNMANETIEYNIDTWDPRPEGIFVGGSIAESSMKLRQVATGDDSQLLLSTLVQFQSDYLSTGASEFWVRLPLLVDEDFLPDIVNFYIFEVDGPGTYSIEYQPSYLGLPIGGPELWLNSTTGAILRGWYGNVANINTGPIYRTLDSDSFLNDGRLYCRLLAPLLTERYYVLTTIADFGPGIPYEFFICPSDLASDDLLASHIAFAYAPSPDLLQLSIFPAEVDLGYSFVFQRGIGGLAVDYNEYFYEGEVLLFYEFVKSDEAYYSGCLNFLMEFRTQSTDPVTWGLKIEAETDAGDIDAISEAYWTGQDANQYILASNPVAHNYTAIELGGEYYFRFRIQLTIESDGRIQFMTRYDETGPVQGQFTNQNYILHADALGNQRAFIHFNMWATCALQDNSLNVTAGTDLDQTSGFWEGVGRWWDKHWVDVVGFTLVAVGLIAVPFTGGLSIALVVAGITMLLYDNWPAFRDAVDSFVGMLTDGLTWLGDWLYKIGMAIWKALTWFVDQLIYYGSLLIGMLMIVVALAIVIIPVYMTMNIMGGILLLVKGDMKGAGTSFRKVTKPIKRTLRRF